MDESIIPGVSAHELLAAVQGIRDALDDLENEPNTEPRKEIAADIDIDFTPSRQRELLEYLAWRLRDLNGKNAGVDWDKCQELKKGEWEIG